MKKSRMPKRKWSSGRGALMIIAFLFISSAIIRIGSGAGQAIAQEVTALRSDTEEKIPLICERPAEIEEILVALASRGEYLDKRERKLGELEQTLAVAEDQVLAKLEALVAAEERLSATIALSDSAAENDLARLTSVYENMKPKQAADLFEEMAPDFAAGFVGRMRPDAAAEIMAGLTPQTAYTISVILAGRNALAPTE